MAALASEIDRRAAACSGRRYRPSSHHGRIRTGRSNGQTAAFRRSALRTANSPPGRTPACHPFRPNSGRAGGNKPCLAFGGRGRRVGRFSLACRVQQRVGKGVGFVDVELLLGLPGKEQWEGEPRRGGSETDGIVITDEIPLSSKGGEPASAATRLRYRLDPPKAACRREQRPATPSSRHRFRVGGYRPAIERRARRWRQFPRRRPRPAR